MVLGSYNDYSYIIENARKKFEEQMKPENIALYLYSIL